MSLIYSPTSSSCLGWFVILEAWGCGDGNVGCAPYLSLGVWHSFCTRWWWTGSHQCPVSSLQQHREPGISTQLLVRCSVCAAAKGTEFGWKQGWGKGSNPNQRVNQSLEGLVTKTFLFSRQIEHPLSPCFLPLLQQLEQPTIHLRFSPFSVLFHSTIAISKADEPKPRPHHPSLERQSSAMQVKLKKTQVT